MSFKQFIDEDEYKWSGKEKHLFDLRPKFKIDDKVKINKKLKLYIAQIKYDLDYAYIFDSNKNDEDENTYRIWNQEVNRNYIINHTKKNPPFDDDELRFKEEDLKSMEK